MAPASREVTQTTPGLYPTDVTIVRRETHSWPTNTFVTLTWPDSPPLTAVVQTAATPTWTYSAESNGGLSTGAKGAIAGSILGTAFLLLLLYCWCKRPKRSRSASRSQRRFVRVPLPDPPRDPAVDPSAPSKKKKTVTIAPEPPKDGSDPKPGRPSFSPVVKFTTDMSSKTTIDIRESKRGNPMPYIIRPLEKAKS